MGQTGSNMVKRMFSPFGGKQNSDDGQDYSSLRSADGSVAPYVFRRVGSMYLNAEGDLAHEFYEEVETEHGIIMKRTPSTELIPQGFVELKFPRLNMDFPVVLCEVRKR